MVTIRWLPLICAVACSLYWKNLLLNRQVELNRAACARDLDLAITHLWKVGSSVRGSYKQLARQITNMMGWKPLHINKKMIG